MTETQIGKNLLSEAQWLWPQPNHFDIYNCYAQFRKDFYLAAVPSGEVMLYITADQCYRLWVNGVSASRGPARGYQSHWPYDEVDVSKYLQAGHNYISVEVYNAGRSTFGYLSESSAGLLCASNIGDLPIRSDATWICRLDKAHKFDTARYSFQINFQEHVDTSKDDRKWITLHDVPAGQDWISPDVVSFGSLPWSDFEERQIPLLREHIRSPKSKISIAKGPLGDDFKDWRNIAKGLFKEFESAAWIHQNDKLEENQPIVFSETPVGTMQAIILDFGEEVVGPLKIEVNGGTKGEIVDLFFHEVLSPFKSPVMIEPDSTYCRMAMANRLILSGPNVEHEFFQILGFRYVTVIIRENLSAVSLNITAVDTGYPYSLEGSFECSDENLNGIWNICRRTQEVCSLDSYVDTPWREQAQWWGDARVQFWNTMAIDGDTRLFKRGIRSIAGQKSFNGLTYGHAPTMAHNCILPDFSLVWILSVDDYFWQTGDLSLFEEQIQRIESVLNYFEDNQQKNNGLIGYDPRFWLFIDWAPIRKEKYSAIYNMWYLLTLRTVTKLYNQIGLEQKAKEFSQKSAILESKIVEVLFDSESNLFVDCADSNGERYKEHSVHAQTLAIMLGLKPEFHKTMFEKRILPFLDNEALECATPSIYWSCYVLTLARAHGFANEVLQYITRNWTPFIPYGTCPENFGTTIGNAFGNDSFSHAWSAHPTFHLMNILGGVVQKDVGWNVICFEPLFPEGIDWVRSVQPTPHGIIESSWERIDGKIQIELSLPIGVTALIKISGFEGEIVDNFSCVI